MVKSKNLVNLTINLKLLPYEKIIIIGARNGSFFRL